MTTKMKRKFTNGDWTKCFVLLFLSLSFIHVILSFNSSGMGSMFVPDAPVSEVSNSICLETGNMKQRHRPSMTDIDKCLIEIRPSAYMSLLMKSLTGSPLAGSCNGKTGCRLPHVAYKSEKRKFGIDWPPYGYTMIGEERLKNLHSAIHEVHRNQIPGAIMEFGVWRGGAMIMAVAALKELGATRDIYLFDAFGPVTKTSYGPNHDFLMVNVEEVKENFKYFEVYDPDRIHFVKGKFSSTVQSWSDRSDPIAVLRLDGNFYDSHQDVLYALYENVAVGGILIFDDVMGDKEVLRSWQEFKKDHGLREELVQIDKLSAWFRKKDYVQIDQSKKRPPKNRDMM
mmetsp:Transcript_15065/g.36837  ORF Transcript_15065/g.36837 Transcript_15065/m.36837 type:complete len:341 (-) Transcript_15065:104-1126(-)